MWVASLHLQFWQSEYFLSLPSVSCGTKTPPTENHCFRQMVGIYFNFLSKKGNSPTKVSFSLYAVHAESLLLCLTLCDPMDCSQPGSSVCGIFQARTLEWVAISFSRGSSWPRDRTCCLLSSALAGRFFTTSAHFHWEAHFLHAPCMLSHFSGVWFFATPWTVACQAPLPMGLSRQEHWSGLPFPSPCMLVTLFFQN